MSLSAEGSVSRLVPLPIPAAHWVLLAPLFIHSVFYVAHADGMNVECIAECKTDLVLLTHSEYFWSLMLQKKESRQGSGQGRGRTGSHFY